jgi:hypothetical protein
VVVRGRRRGILLDVGRDGLKASKKPGPWAHGSCHRRSANAARG